MFFAYLAIHQVRMGLSVFLVIVRRKKSNNPESASDQGSSVGPSKASEDLGVRSLAWHELATVPTAFTKGSVLSCTLVSAALSQDQLNIIRSLALTRCSAPAAKKTIIDIRSSHLAAFDARSIFVSWHRAILRVTLLYVRRYRQPKPGRSITKARLKRLHKCSLGFDRLCRYLKLQSTQGTAGHMLFDGGTGRILGQRFHTANHNMSS